MIRLLVLVILMTSYSIYPISIKKMADIKIEDLPESSGMAFSKINEGHIYHINDSEEKYISILTTNKKFKIINRSIIQNYRPIDHEAIQTAPCYYNKQVSCLYIADFGDNRLTRKNIKLIIIPEEDLSKKKIKAKNILTFTYPDKSHNAEAFIITPNTSNFIIITKEYDKKNKKGKSAKLYKHNLKNIQKTNKLIKTGEINIPKLATNKTQWGEIVTDAALSNNGKNLFIATYEQIIQFKIDIKKNQYDHIRNIDLFGLLPQFEALAINPKNENEIFISSEVDSVIGKFKTLPLLKIDLKR